MQTGLAEKEILRDVLVTPIEGLLKTTLAGLLAERARKSAEARHFDQALADYDEIIAIDIYDLQVAAAFKPRLLAIRPFLFRGIVYLANSDGYHLSNPGIDPALCCGRCHHSIYLSHPCPRRTCGSDARLGRLGGNMELATFHYYCIRDRHYVRDGRAGWHSKNTPLVIITSMLATTIAVATPLTLGALCGLYCERAGVVNIGIEGTMLGAAFFGWLASIYMNTIFHFPADAEFDRWSYCCSIGWRLVRFTACGSIHHVQSGSNHRRNSHQYSRLRHYRFSKSSDVLWREQCVSRADTG